MKLLIPIFLNCLLVTVIYLADKYSPTKKLSYMKKQVIIGIVFGLSSAFASIYGVDWLGTKANVRDAAPLSAGLIFGAPAGIISGVIGGLFRWFSVIWNPDADYTQLACSLATVLAGLMAAGLRKFMFDNKKPTWGYGVCITAVCEVVHMSLIFLTNMDNSSYAFKFVKGASLIMILGNALSVGLSIIIVTLLSRDKSTKKKGPQIARTFQRWLLACIVVAYLVTSTFTFFLQNGIAQIETQELFTSSINDVKTDVKGKSDNYLLELVKEIADAHLKNPDTPLTELAATYDVIEINIVGKDGFIQNSTNSSLVNNFNMNSTQQSKEFMVLSQGEASFVQEYGPVGSDGKTMRKFAGIALEDGNYIQVGYSAEQFHKMLDEFVIDVTKNRHVGTQGFVAVCDENLNLVTENEYGKKHISSIGLIPNEEMKSGSSASSLYETPITNSTNGYREDYIYVFDFAEGYCIIAAMPKADAMFMRDASLFTSVFMQVLIFATLFVFIYILIKKVIINNLKKINSSLGQITNGNL
ncbi:MAG: LytS/YhcK type 5TM receptor domain-containing protein, partial [Bacillota bacterium]|nr:LytS/YhcK type 5TM receptor domain-containing protein [Bacillota bacterium]